MQGNRAAVIASPPSARRRVLLLVGLTLLFMGGLRPHSPVTISAATSTESGIVSAAGMDSADEATVATKRVLAYFPLWVRNSGYTPRDVRWDVVNHIAHFSVVPRADGSIEIPDWGPFPDNELVTTAHQRGARVSLVVGGDHAAARQGFSAMAADPATRGRFVTALLELVNRHAYDGVDLDWEFPESEADRANLTALVRELRRALGEGRTLSIAAPSSDWFGRWFDVPALLPHLTWLGAMSYDMHGPGWSEVAGHNAPLLPRRPDELSVDATRAYYLSRGVPADKLLLGLPFFGKRFDGASDINQKLTNHEGAALDYREVQALIGRGWESRRDSTAQTPYLVRAAGQGSGVISYDDPASIAAKCRYVAINNLGGVIIWHLGKDALPNGQPLLEAVRF